MELKKVSDEDYEYLHYQYNKAFPVDERAPFRRVWKKAQDGKADFLGLYSHDRCIGFAYLVKYKDIVYIIYVAIDHRLRGRGLGTKMMNSILKRNAGKRIFLSCEPPDPKAKNAEDRERRREFYRRCGLEELPNKIYEADVCYSMMGTGGHVKPEEYRALMQWHVGKVMSRILGLRMEKGGDEA